MKESDTIHFLDLGSSQIPDRVRELAWHHPKRQFVAVDQHPLWPEEKLPSNAKYVESDVIQYMKTLREGSVRIVNADFLLNEMPEEQIRELIGHVKRVLKSNGKAYFSEDRQNIEDIRKMLHEHGFTTFARDLTKKEAEKPKTFFNEVRIQRPQHWRESRKELPVTWPVRIVATKRIKATRQKD